MARILDRVTAMHPTTGKTISLTREYDHEYLEYSVRVRINGKRIPERDYFAGDSAIDAELTQAAMLNEFYSKGV